MAVLKLELRTDAIAEARRLNLARSVAGGEDRRVLAHCEGAGPLVARARKHDLRRRLAGRMLLVWRVSVENAAGDPLESQLVALLIDPIVRASGLGLVAEPARARPRVRWRTLLQDLEPALRAHVERAAAPWFEIAVAAADRFTSARTARDRAIAERLAGARPSAFQAGLFDRRADRAHRAAVDAAERDQRRRLRTVGAVDAVRSRTFRADLMLVSTP
jgi:hypothetical protein